MKTRPSMAVLFLLAGLGVLGPWFGLDAGEVPEGSRGGTGQAEQAVEGKSSRDPYARGGSSGPPGGATEKGEKGGEKKTVDPFGAGVRVGVEIKSGGVVVTVGTDKEDDKTKEGETAAVANQGSRAAGNKGKEGAKKKEGKKASRKAGKGKEKKGEVGCQAGKKCPEYVVDPVSAAKLRDAAHKETEERVKSGHDAAIGVRDRAMQTVEELLEGGRRTPAPKEDDAFLIPVPNPR